MPGAGRTHGPPATKKAGGSDHRFSRSNPAFPAQWFYGLLRALPGVPGFVATVARGACFRRLDPSVGGPEPHAFAVRLRRVRRAQPRRPSHPASNTGDDAQRPS
jgi:hypothetical protein